MPAAPNGARPLDIRSVYARIAPVYDLWAGLERRARRRCLELARVKDGESVLEVAAGTGLAFVELVRANPSGTTEGVDLTEEMLVRARAKVASLPGRHRLRVGDARRLDFPDSTFDLVTNAYMFDLLPEDDFVPVLAEFRRVLRPGGRAVLCNLARPESISSRAWSLVHRAWPALLGGCRPVALGPSVEKAGFEIVEREFVRQVMLDSEIIVARNPASRAQEVSVPVRS